MLAAYAWPGNIRELVNVIDFACAIATEPEIGMDDLPDQVFRRTAVELAGNEGVDARHTTDEAATLREDLRRMGWNVSATARLLGIDRTTLAPAHAPVGSLPAASHIIRPAPHLWRQLPQVTQHSPQQRLAVFAGANDLLQSLHH